jgi:hypothetical protein
MTNHATKVRRSARSHGEHGAALLEFALAVPLLLLLVLGIIEFGHYYYVTVAAADAAREGARQCTLVSLGGCGDCSPSDAVSHMKKLRLGDNTSAKASCDVVDGTYMYTVNVAVEYQTLTGFFPALGAMSESITPGNAVAYGVSVMRGQ